MKRTKAEQIRRYFIFLVGLFVNSLGVSLITKGKSWNFSDILHSLCTQSEFSVFTGKFYHCVQFASDLFSVFAPGEEFQGRAFITDSCFHGIWLFY